MDQDEAVQVQAGDVLAGKYQVERVLGIGGMGAVVAATHLDLGERRAIKLMLPEMLASPEAVERFMREARASARLKSEHAVRVHDVGRLDSGEPYMVMEMLEGQDLAQLLEQLGPLPPGQAVDFVLQALEALDEAHAAGIVHRDIKPSNLFATRATEGMPTIKVLDFGISKLSDGGSPSMTQTTAVFGSPDYMSPEQMVSTKDADVRSDIWSLGVVLYELLVGTVPFLGRTATALFVQVVQRRPRPPSELNEQLPPGLESVVMRCLAKLPEERYQSVGELAAALAPFAATDPTRSLRRLRRWLGAPSATAPLREVGQAAPSAALPALEAHPPLRPRGARPPQRFSGGSRTCKLPTSSCPQPGPPPGQAQRAGAQTSAAWERATRPITPGARPPAAVPAAVGLVTAVAIGAAVLVGLTSPWVQAAEEPQPAGAGEPAPAQAPVEASRTSWVVHTSSVPTQPLDGGSLNEVVDADAPAPSSSTPGPGPARAGSSNDRPPIR